ncbi:hypothetical protein [Mesorhizobium sp. M0491]|uniref:hypothetical protein n=1 Tax=Mesorhizobium sp. M0491 TaxID=2956950 RepID=UPI00333D019B
MRDEDFEPKPRKNTRHPRPEIPRSLPSANLARGWESRGKGTFHGTGIGRGAGVCSELASRDRFAASQPRLVIKSRVVKLDGKGLQSARAHLRYIQRAGIR